MNEIMPTWDKRKGNPLYAQLYEYIKNEIQRGNIKAESKLPSKRKLSGYLGISQNTIQTAYEQLCAEGYVESRPRVGLFVKELEDNLIGDMGNAHDFDNKVKYKDKYNIDFNSGAIDTNNFPYTIWRKLMVESLYSGEGDLLQTANPQGEETLREEIAKYIFQGRGAQCTSDQIVIGAGTQYLLILLSMIIGKDQLFAIENPGYNRVRRVLKDQGVTLVPISIDEKGIDINALKNSKAKVVYITPSHQFPYGTIMPISRRLELLKWCEGNDGYVIEDDYDSEFRHKGMPIPALQSLDKSGRVIYLGTFSKSLIPSMRISFLVLPSKLLKRYQEHFIIYKQTVSRLHQDTLYRFIKGGYFSRHINKMRTLYRRKHGVLISAIMNEFKDNVEIIGEKSGLHILLKIKNGMNENELIEAAGKIKIRIYPTSIYYTEGGSMGDPMVLLGFGGLSEKQIKEGISLLKDVWSPRD